MGKLRLVWYNDGKQKWNSSTVYVREENGSGLSDVDSLSDIFGTGGCFQDALGDYEEKLNEYINKLIEFRDKVVNTSAAFTDVAGVDCFGDPID